jgi:uncharacterized protein
LHFLFAPAVFVAPAWTNMVEDPEPFLAKTHAAQFLGFASAQMRRLFNQEGQKNVHREALEERFGYDTKYAMHVVRLFGEAKEFLESGRITLPRPEREMLIDIRKGKWAMSDFLAYAKQLEAEALAAQATSPLPDQVDRNKISALVSRAYREHWNCRNLV